MKKLKKIFLLSFVGVGMLFTACEPNEELYEELDEIKKPFNEEVEYTLIEDDYTRFDGFIEDNLAFSDSFPSMDYIPEVLKVRFVTLKEESTAQVTYNHFLLNPDWWDAGFGYLLTQEDYLNIGVTSLTFTPSRPARNDVPVLLTIKFPDAEEGDTQSVIYNFLLEGESVLNVDVYEFDGSNWIWIETTEDVPYAGYELTEEDYQQLHIEIGQFNSFNENYPPEAYLPALLRNKFSYAVDGQEQVVKYRHFDGSETVEIIDKYQYNTTWEKVEYIETRTDQYIYGALGWAFDPTVRFTLSSADYQFFVDIDPIGQQELPYNDFAYYYGASAYYANFDIRIQARRLDLLSNGEYADPLLGEIYDNEGAEAATEEMMRRIVEEGIPALLQHKYPEATPQVEGIDVHYFVSFETFADNFVRRNPVAEYICTAAGTPPQFELVEVTGFD